MGPDVIVSVAPAIEVWLAMAEVLPGEITGEQFDFKRPVKPFAFTLGLGMIRAPMDQIDAQSQQPNAQRGEAGFGIGGAPGIAVVGQDDHRAAHSVGKPAAEPLAPVACGSNREPPR